MITRIVVGAAQMNTLPLPLYTQESIVRRSRLVAVVAALSLIIGLTAATDVPAGADPAPSATAWTGSGA